MIYIKKEKELAIDEVFEDEEYIYTPVHDWELYTICNECHKEIEIDNETLKDIVINGELESTKLLCVDCSKDVIKKN